VIDTLRAGMGIKLRKAHACGENRWEVLDAEQRAKIRCMHCGHILHMDMEKLKKACKQILHETGV